MGIDRDLVLTSFGGVIEELVCAICTDILEQPIMLKNCQHHICTTCITEFQASKGSTWVNPLGRPIVDTQCPGWGNIL